MERREFLKKITVPLLATVGSGCITGDAGENGTSNPDGAGTMASGTLSELAFYSPASQVSTDGGALEEGVVVRAEETARSTDTTDSEPYMYHEGDEPPLVAEEGSVVGFGSTELVSDTSGGFEHGNEEFLLNLWDAKVDGSVVLWDGGHDQYWNLQKYSVFRGYAEDEGYDVRATESLVDDIREADGVVVTSPVEPFTDEELDALVRFVEDDGAVFLHDQSDFQGHDETGNLNAVAESLDLSFRFNSDQINDDTNNTTAEFIPLTSNFDAPAGYFTRRDASVEPEGADVEQGEEYVVNVVGVEDGDTADVVFEDGTVERVRFLGMDTPEVTGVDERVAEWSGIDDEEHLRDWAERAGEFGRDKFADETVTLVFDEEEPVRGKYGRLTAYVRYDSSGDGSHNTEYNLEAVEQGYARAYSSGFGSHDTYSRAENDAFVNRRGLWEAADLDALDEFRNSPVEEMFFPHAVVVEGDGVVSAETTAEPSEVPLVAVDKDARVAAVGAPIMSEDYEQAEGFDADTSGYGNYTFLTNLAYDLSERDGDAFFEGGHGQFNAEGSLASEDAAYYGRHLGGFGRRLRQVNDLPKTLSEVDAATLVISPPATEYTDEEIGAVREFIDGGGSVVLVGDSRSAHLGKLDALTDALDAGVGFEANAITDGTNNVAGDESLVVTSNFDGSYNLFGRFEAARNRHSAISPP